jgi:hypothetical protein
LVRFHAEGAGPREALTVIKVDKKVPICGPHRVRGKIVRRHRRS